MKNKFSRRQFNVLAGAGTIGLLSGAGPAWAAQNAYKPTLTEDGHYTEPWFLEGFLDLKDDLETAQKAGKRLAIIWEYAGCPYCRETHLVNFAVPEITDYIKENFEVVQMDYHGLRETVGFDGKTLKERGYAKSQRIRFTPTIQFISETLVGEKLYDGKTKIEVARMPGYFRPFHFLTMFQYVRDKGYVTGDYRSYLKTKIESYSRKGKKLPSW